VLPRHRPPGPLLRRVLYVQKSVVCALSRVLQRLRRIIVLIL
jgi:hypothetical protein